MYFLPQNVEKIISVLEENGYEAYVVGGSVRDMLLNRVPTDFDITTNCLPEQIASLFEKTVKTGIKHGTVSVITENGNVEVTTYRSDGQYSDNRKPDNVIFEASLNKDLSRRDFTINAICYNHKTGLIDIFGGINDINNKIIKTVGDPKKRFSEDALRILRCLRFASTLGFAIESQTEKAIESTNKLLCGISRERIFAELNKTLCGKQPNILEKFIKIGGLEFLGIINAENLNSLTILPPKAEIRFIAFCECCKIDAIDLCQKLKSSNKFKNYIKNFEILKQFSSPFNDINIKQMLKSSEYEVVLDYLEYKSATENLDFEKYKNALKRIINSTEPYKISMLKINGFDILKLGYPAESIGDILNKLLDICIISPENNTYEKLINLIKEN